MPSLRPADVLAALSRADATAPRLTHYDDTTGERIELSARTLGNWVAKAANLLQDDADAGPGTSVGLDLPAHWRAAYWALATWSVGATLVVGDAARAADVVVTTSPELASAAMEDGRYAVLVTLAALARRNPAAPPGVVDEAAELANQPDVFDALNEWGDGDPAWRATSPADAAYGQLVRAEAHPAGTRAVVPDALGPMLRAALDVWAVGGSIVLLHDALGDQTKRLAAERVTVDLRA